MFKLLRQARNCAALIGLAFLGPAYCPKAALAAEPARATSEAAPTRIELAGPDRSNALDELQKLRNALRTHISGYGIASNQIVYEVANTKFHNKSSGSLKVTFAFDWNNELVRVLNEDPQIGFVKSTLQSGPVVVLLARDPVKSSAGKVKGHYWQIFRYSDNATVPRGKPPRAPGFARGDDWSYRAILAVPDSTPEDRLFKFAREGEYHVYREANNLILYSESTSHNLGKFTSRYIFNLAQGGVLVSAAFTHDSYSSKTYNYQWAQTPQGDVVPTKFSMRLVETNMEGTDWYNLTRNVTFTEFALGPVPAKDLSLRALAPPGTGIPAGTLVTNYADQKPGQQPPTFIYSEPAWKKIIGEDPAEEIGTPAR